MPDDIAIKVEHVSKNFVLPHEKVRSVKSAFTGMFRRGRTKEVQHALKDIDFEIRKGEFFGIVGRNGSGKSTLLKILAGIYQPTTGRVHTNGKLVPFIELGVGFNPELTGRENVYLNGAMLGFSEKEVDAMYDDIVSFAELERFMDQKLKNYSSGMQVRLAFSMATRSEADILLVDEVLAVGDADFQRKCYDYFKSLKRNKKTVVFVSHDMNAVREFCDRVVLIDKNVVVDSGTAARVSVKYTRLFMTNDTSNVSEDVGIDDNRWGNQEVTIEKAKLSSKNVNEDTSDIELSMTIKAHSDTDDTVVGFVVKNAADEEICGTNTQLIRQPLPRLTQGQTYDLTWVLPNIFTDGIYNVDVAVHRSDGVTVNDWWEKALTFQVKRLQQTSYKTAPKITLRTSK